MLHYLFTLLQETFQWDKRQEAARWGAAAVSQSPWQVGCPDAPAPRNVSPGLPRRDRNAGSVQNRLSKKVQSVISVAQSCPTLCDPMNCSAPGLPVHQQLLRFTQIHVHSVDSAIQPSHPLSSPSPPALNPSQHQGLFQWVSFSNQVANVLEFQLHHQSFQWTPRMDLL